AEFAHAAFQNPRDFNYYLSGMVHNLDGLIFRTDNTNRDHIDEYFQVYRSGAIEHVRVYEDNYEQKDELIYRLWTEDVGRGLDYCLKLQRGLGIEEPFFIALTLAHISQYKWVVAAGRNLRHRASIKIRHDPLRFPEQYFEQRDLDPYQM